MNPAANACPDCRRELKPEWQACPFCGFRLASGEVQFLTPGAGKPSGSSLGNEPPVTAWTPNDMPPRREAKRDMMIVGAGLVLLGVLGFFTLMRVMLTGGERFSLDWMMYGGGGLVVMILVGALMFGTSAGNAQGVVGSLIGGLLAGVFAVTLSVIVVIAAIVFLIADFFRAISS